MPLDVAGGEAGRDAASGPAVAMYAPTPRSLAPEKVSPSNRPSSGRGRIGWPEMRCRLAIHQRSSARHSAESSTRASRERRTAQRLEDRGGGGAEVDHVVHRAGAEAPQVEAMRPLMAATALMQTVDGPAAMAAAFVRMRSIVSGGTWYVCEARSTMVPSARKEDRASDIPVHFVGWISQPTRQAAAVVSRERCEVVLGSWLSRRAGCGAHLGRPAQIPALDAAGGCGRVARAA